MKLKEVQLTRFKRFTETTITNIPETAKLVIIAGPNGCGKSSFFEALNVWSRTKHLGLNWDPTYYVKLPEKGTIDQHRAVRLTFHGGEPTNPKKAIYIRSAYRNDPSFQTESFHAQKSALEENRLQRLIENDAAVGKNYQRLVAQALEDMFERESKTTTIEAYREKIIGNLRSATQRLFPDLILNSLGNPLNTGTFKFDKGEAKGFLYKNLSGGEKAAFDLILDIIVKRKEFDDTVFCIDEPEAHMNTRLQGALLEELFEATGPDCQLWLATHSIGMMRKARDLSNDHPNEIIYLNFGGRDFDIKQTIQPVKPTRAFWQDVLDVAFDDFASLIAPREVILCEGAYIGSGGKSDGIDAKIYEKIFSDEYPETRFIPAGNCHAVEADRLALISAMEALVSGTTVRRLIDRDDLSPSEVREKVDSGVSVLGRRNIECYLFDDELIHLLAQKHGRQDLAETLINAKTEEMEKATQIRRRPVDDVKAAAGPLMDRLKQSLLLTQCGGNTKEFMRVTMAPLMTPDTNVYKELRASVFRVQGI